ncbi:unnamed protein product [Closterium sp. NIES-53]
MPFGLTNAPATFQAEMNHILRPLLDECVVVYLDDVLIYSKDMKQHVEHLRRVFEILRRERFYVKLSKSKFALKKVQFLGHMVSAQGVHVDPKKIEAVRTWKTPENVKELQQFLGFANYYNRLVPNYAKIAAPLTNLLKKNTPYQWEAKHQEAVEQLKTALTSAPVLILPDPELDYVIEADASDQAVGVVLMQDQGKGMQPIAYLSKKLHGAELNHPIHDKEALAIVNAFKAWRCYLEGRKTTIYTDHCSLKYLKTQPTLSRRQVRWIEFLETHFHYDIVDSDDDDAKGGRGRSGSRRPHRGINQPCKEKQSTKSSTSAKDADSSAGGQGRDDKEASCSLVVIVEPTVSLAPEAGEDFLAMEAAVQANPAVVLLNSGCSHHLMGTEEVSVDVQPSGDVKHVRGFNGALQWSGTENGVKQHEEGNGMVLVSAAGDVLGRASYTGQVLCTNLHPCSAKSKTPTTKGRGPASDRLGDEVATGLDLKSASGADLPCVTCVGGKLAWHTFPEQGSDAEDVLAVVHVDLCGPFRVAAKDGSLYFLLLKDRKTRYVWVRPVAKKSDALQEFVQWLAVTERQTKKSVLMLRSDRGGEFLGKRFTDFVNARGSSTT